MPLAFHAAARALFPRHLKKIMAGAAALCALGGAAQAQLVLTGIFDGPLTGGLPKGVEFYATQNIPDLSLYQVVTYANGSGTATTPFTFSGSATAGEFLYFAYTTGTTGTDAFAAFFGFAPDFSGNAVNVNGDDVVAIRLASDSSIIDVTGPIGTDGTGEPWEYLDGWAYRNDGAAASSTYNAADWTFSGIDQLEGGATNAATTAPFPIGAYSPVVPEPGSAMLIGLGLAACFGARRRKG